MQAETVFSLAEIAGTIFSTLETDGDRSDSEIKRKVFERLCTTEVIEGAESVLSTDEPENGPIQ